MTATVRMGAPTWRQAVSQSLVVARRDLIRFPRNPQLLVFTALQPIMFVVLFDAVFGRAMELIVGAESGGYIDFLVPGIAVQTISFGSIAMAVGLAADLQSGMLDRLRSLPIARSAVLAGRVTADTVRVVATLLIMILAGLVLGFRFSEGAGSAALMLAVVVYFGVAIAWISVNVGLRTGSPETAQLAQFVWVFPLVFMSSTFVPVEAMSDWIQPIARVNPITAQVDAARALANGCPPTDPDCVVTTEVFRALAWSTGLIVVFAPLAVRRFRRI